MKVLFKEISCNVQRSTLFVKSIFSYPKNTGFQVQIVTMSDFVYIIYFWQ